MFEVPMVEVGMGTLLEPSPGRQVLEEEISANTSRASTTTGGMFEVPMVEVGMGTSNIP